MQKRFKVILVGDSGVGKSAFRKRVTKDTFDERHISTYGVDISSIVIQTTVGDVIFDLWDTTGDERYSDSNHTYYEGSHCVIGMFDVSCDKSRENVYNWYRGVHSCCGCIPFIMCGNKSDKPCSSPHRINNNGYDILTISAKNTDNIRLPFLFLARMLLSDFDIQLI